MTDQEFLEKMKYFRLDHEPNGYPAIQQCEVDRMLEMIEGYRGALERILTAHHPNYGLCNEIAREALNEK